MKYIYWLIFLLFIMSLVWIGVTFRVNNREVQTEISESAIIQADTKIDDKERLSHPLMIEEMRAREYLGSELVIEETLANGSNYSRYLASYQSDGLKIYGLLTIPIGDPPQNGWSAIIFNHGYIPPEQYRSTERYIAYVDGFARNRYIVFRPDYRGHGNSEGVPVGAYFSPGYTVDVLHAFSSVQRLDEVNPERIGMWGHSLGGHITLRSMVINPQIKAGVIWGGVVGSYADMYTYWWSKRRSPWTPSAREQSAQRPHREDFVSSYGEVSQDSPFWRSISPITFVEDISGPIQLHHGLADETVPWELSEQLYNALLAEKKDVEFYTYEYGDHNLSDPSFGIAMQRSIEFFDMYLKDY